MERVIPGGEGIARLPDGRALFVPGGLPGDGIVATALDVRGSWARATSWELAVPSPQRRTPPCALADRCGGCDWISWVRSAQLEGKATLVVDALRRTGGIEARPPVVEHAGPELGWRGRVRLTVAQDGSQLGFLARGSHEVVDVPRCPVATDAVNEGLLRLRTFARDHGLRGVKSVELRSAPRGAAVSARVELESQRSGAAARTAAAVEALFPADPQSWPLPGDVWLSASPGTFTQVHDEANLRLVEAVLAGVGDGAGLVLDACCGAGNFTLPLLAAGRDVRAFDQSRDAIADLRRAASAHGLVPDDVRAARMEPELRRLARERLPVQAVILDPPRKGIRDAVPALLALRPERIVYVACDPVSLARDARALLAGGYALHDLRCIDLFPQTHHVETVGVFVLDQRPK